MTADDGPPEPTPPTTVVIADDDADIRALVAIAARRAGATVEACVGDGVQAWQAIEQTRPALAVLDVAMPGLTGLEICRLIRRNPGLTGTRILLLSASVHAVAVNDGMLAGADLYVEKPFGVRSLATRIGDLLRPGAGGP